jgi:hypothetical protein
MSIRYGSASGSVDPTTAMYLDTPSAPLAGILVLLTASFALALLLPAWR